MSKICANCGMEWPDEFKFCVSCGQKFPSEPMKNVTDEPPTIPPEKRQETFPVVQKAKPKEAISDIPQPAPAAVDSQKMSDYTNPQHNTKYCANCGAAISPGQNFCIGCGQMVTERPVRYAPQDVQSSAAGEPATNFSQPSGISETQEYTKDPNVKNILTVYGTKRMLMRQLPFVLIMLAAAIIIAIWAPDDQEFPFDLFFDAPILAFMAWRVYRRPGIYNAKRKKGLMLCGYNPTQTKMILKENPIFGIKYKMKPVYAHLLGTIGRVILAIGLIITVYGLFAAVLSQLVGIVLEDYNLDLYLKGLCFITAGMLAAYTGKIFKGVSKC